VKAKNEILVIDDDQDILNTISKLLRREGYAVDTAKTGQEALEKSKEKFYSLALIDIKLPDFEGIELLERIEAIEPKMRKVIVTGYPTPENTRRALYLGADVYLVKPLKAEELLRTVKMQLMERDKDFKKKYILLKNQDQDSEE